VREGKFSVGYLRVVYMCRIEEAWVNEYVRVLYSQRGYVRVVRVAEGTKCEGG